MSKFRNVTDFLHRPNLTPVSVKERRE